MGKKRTAAAKPADEAEEVEQEEEEAADEAEDKEAPAGAVRVLNESGDVVRVFSKELHGKYYRKMAEAVVAKYPKRKYRLG